MSDTNDATTALTKPSTKRLRKMAREPNAETLDQQTPNAAPAKRQSKAELVLGLLKHPEGVTIDQLVDATDWLPHTARAALTGLKKKGHAVISEKVESVRRYRIDAATG